MQRTFVLFAALSLGACAIATPVMDTGDGTYMVSARAAPAAGGATGAQTHAYKQAQAHCAASGQKAVVIGTNDRDVYQAGFGGSAYGYGGGMSAAGEAKLRFRCVQ